MIPADNESDASKDLLPSGDKHSFPRAVTEVKLTILMIIAKLSSGISVPSTRLYHIQTHHTNE